VRLVLSQAVRKDEYLHVEGQTGFLRRGVGH